MILLQIRATVAVRVASRGLIKIAEIFYFPPIRQAVVVEIVFAFGRATGGVERGDFCVGQGAALTLNPCDPLKLPRVAASVRTWFFGRGAGALPTTSHLGFSAWLQSKNQSGFALRG